MFSITSMLKVVNLSLCVWGLLACKTFLKTELFHTETLRSVFTLAVHDESDPDWIPESPSKLQEAGKGQIYVPTRKKKSDMRERVKYVWYFCCGFWKNIARTKENYL